MSFFITDAMAAAAPAAAGQPQGGLLEALFFPAVILVVFYFLLVRPQQKRAKEHTKMVEALGKGDEVVTQGGLLGKITDVGENFIEVELADNVKVKVQRQMIASLMPKGTLKTL